MTRADELYIIDAVHYLFRSYYAIGPMTNGKGESTNALYGFTQSILKFIKDFSPKYVVCVFDGPDNKKERLEIYSEYKMNRKKAPEDLYMQFNRAFEFLSLLGISTLSVGGVEADDTMAGIAKWGEKEFDKIFLLTSDKDLFQLVSGNTFVLSTYKDNLIIDKEKVEEQFGVKPGQIVDFLAITGDASDNIPGIEGFGPKTAASLLQEYESLENIYANIDKIGGKKKETLIKNRDNAFLSQKLASLNFNVPFPKEKEFFRFKETRLEELNKFYQEVQFLRLLKETSHHATEDKTDYTLINDEKSLALLEEDLLKEQEIAIDTETTSLNFMEASLVGFGLAVKAKKAFYIPLNGNLSKETVFNFLHKISKKSFIGHNIKYDYHILKNFGITLDHLFFDTMIASYLLTPQSRRHGLDTLSLEKFQKVKIPIEELIGEKKEGSMLDAPLDKIKEYCCEDVDYTLQLKELFEKELDKPLEKLLKTVEMPLVKILASMERNGVFVNREKLQKIGVDLKEELANVSQKIFKEVGEEFNLNSPKQLGNILYNKLKLPAPKKELSTSAEVLEDLSDKFPIVNEILKYRELQKLLSTYVEALILQINPATGRIHPTFNQSVTATGRLSCQDPNLQNIPVRTKEGRKIRSAFMPEKENFSLVSFDYSQIELRLLAHFSEDEALIRAFKNGEDIHASTASTIFSIPLGLVTNEMRQMAKAVNFGIVYGQGPYGLSKQLKIGIKEAALFIDSYFKEYPKIASFIEEMKAFAEKNGYAETLLRRRRPLPEISSKNPSIRAFAERLAVNTPLQGTAADIIKIAMIEVDKALKESSAKMILQIHDELIFEAPDREIPSLVEVVKEKMEKAYILKVPLIVDVEIGKNWEEC